MSGPGAHSESESEAAALKALAVRVVAATGFLVVLARGSSGSGGRTPASGAPCALSLSLPVIMYTSEQCSTVTSVHNVCCIQRVLAWTCAHAAALQRLHTNEPLTHKIQCLGLSVQVRGGRGDRQSQSLNP